MESEEITNRVENAKRKTRLEWYEAEIEKRARSLAGIFVEMSSDPIKPYLLTHANFEEYCHDRWKMSPRRVQQLKKGESIKALLAAEAPDLAPTIATMNEGQVRELATAPPGKRVEVLREAIKAPKLNSGTIKQAKARVVGTEQDFPMHTTREIGEGPAGRSKPNLHRLMTTPSVIESLDPPTEAESNVPPAGHLEITDDTALELAEMVSDRVQALTGQPITESEDADLAIVIGLWLARTLSTT